MSADAFAFGGQGIGQLFGAASSFLGAKAVEKAAAANEKLARLSASHELMRGSLRQMDVDREAAAVLNAQKVAYAGQNVDLASETVLTVSEETQYEARRAKNLVELDAAMSAWSMTEQAKLNKAAAKDQAKGMRIGGAGQVIGGVGSLTAAGLV